jgi:hypothetical protein
VAAKDLHFFLVARYAPSSRLFDPSRAGSADRDNDSSIHWKGDNDDYHGDAQISAVPKQPRDRIDSFVSPGRGSPVAIRNRRSAAMGRN